MYVRDVEPHWSMEDRLTYGVRLTVALKSGQTVIKPNSNTKPSRSESTGQTRRAANWVLTSALP